ncbi:pyridoxal phosphate-dependent aminotransferase [Sandarakinorhabdus rubra]|uniref:pyridoxal phosphate-dependent aminotransferase n=1 Tax=Sandarakinorhabdus rubra TaxID=2672568 RepID=UPI0013D9E2DF|nr:histidinol-phosphate transaminase [Sandarakinorhabdus rubra]
MDISRRGWLGLAGTTAAATQASAITIRMADPTGFAPAPGIAHLKYNENPLGPPASAIQAMADLARTSWYYADDAEARLAAMIGKRLGVPASQVVLGHGSSEVITSAALAWGRRGTIVMPALQFDEPLLYPMAQGLSLRRVAMAPDMGIDLGALGRAAAAPDVVMIYLCNPNNPTGMVLPTAELVAFARSLPPRVTLLVDEAYMELADDPAARTMLPLVASGANIIVTRTFSKLFGMAGLRIGYAVASPANAAELKRHRLTISLNAPGLAAAIAAWDDTRFQADSRAQIIAARRVLEAAVARAGTVALPSQTNFLFVKVADANRFSAAMAQKGILVRGAWGPAWPNWSRVSTGRLADVQRFADALPGLVNA